MQDYNIVLDIDSIDKNKWSEFVYKHPHGNIFQTPEMYEVYQNTKKYEPVFLAVFNDKDEISGTMLAVIQKEYYGVLGNFTARSIIYGGPLIKDHNPDFLDFLLKKYNKFLKKKAIYSQFRNFWDWKDSKEIFLKNGFGYEEHLNILIDLTKPEEQLWKEVHSKRRNEIRRAKKEGTYFSAENTEDALKKCYSTLQEVYQRAKLPIPDYDFYLNLYNMNFPSALNVFCAYYGNEIIGCMLALCYKDSIYDFYAGSLKKFYNKYPNDLIPWELLKWGKKNNYKCFDFGGAGKPGVPYGVRDYKIKFGGVIVDFGRFEKVHKPFRNKIARIGFEIWRILR